MRASVKSVLLAAHLKVMSMLTDEETFFTGLVCHGRLEAPGAERVCGFHLNTLPFSYDRGARTWRELVGAVFAQEATVWAHRRYPMAEIQREFGHGRRLLDVRFSFLDGHRIDEQLVDLDVGIDDGPTEAGLAVTVLAGHLLLAANPQLISEANMERLAGMYQEVVAAILADPDGDATAAHLPPGELKQLLDAQDRTPTAPELSVREMVEAQARATPDQTAVTFDGAALSYAELDERANQYAHRLRAAGLGPEDVVGVLLDRGPDLIACLLGAWKAGAAYLPLDASFPAERVAGMLAGSGARLLLTQQRYACRVDAAVPALTVVDVADPDIGALPRTPVGVPDDPDRLAYLIFTSGSTGRPKGVQITHRGLANHVAWAARTLIPLGGGGAPLFSSHAFDLVVPNLWAPLATGQPVHLMPADLDPADLGLDLSEAGPFSFIKLTPGHLEALRWQLNDAQAAALAGGIVVAGEALPAELADHWLSRLGPGRLINEYGPTEASVGLDDPGCGRAGRLRDRADRPAAARHDRLRPGRADAAGTHRCHR